MRKKKLKKQPICCGQNFRDWIGYKIVDVQSNKLDLNVRVKLINESGHVVKLFFNDLDFDGDTLFYTESNGNPQTTPTREKKTGSRRMALR